MIFSTIEYCSRTVWAWFCTFEVWNKGDLLARAMLRSICGSLYCGGPTSVWQPTRETLSDVTSPSGYHLPWVSLALIQIHTHTIAPKRALTQSLLGESFFPSYSANHSLFIHNTNTHSKCGGTCVSENWWSCRRKKAIEERLSSNA